METINLKDKLIRSRKLWSETIDTNFLIDLYETLDVTFVLFVYL